ncbi:MAG: hypothetical protein ABR563_05415 [Pyrinomonadaceae bacterium]
MQSSPQTSFASGSRGANMSLVKVVIIITLAVILSILFLGRFLF